MFRLEMFAKESLKTKNLCRAFLKRKFSSHCEILAQPGQTTVVSGTQWC